MMNLTFAKRVAAIMACALSGASAVAADVIADAQVQLSVLPSYPERALRDGVDGEVTVAFTVSRYGRAIDAKITSAAPSKVFDEVTLDALKYWFIRPARADVCETAKQSAQQTFRFTHDANPRVELAPILLDGHKAAAPVSAGALTGHDPDGLVVIRHVDPEYPEKAVARKREGYVTVSFFIERDGKVTKPKIESAKNGALFNRAALRAIRQWRFAPAMHPGAQELRLGCHEFLFNLDDQARQNQKKRIRERSRRIG
ncbi:MAG: energy transducer TonB [Gammaproteobacteria bacterium]